MLTALGIGIVAYLFFIILPETGVEVCLFEYQVVKAKLSIEQRLEILDRLENAEQSFALGFALQHSREEKLQALRKKLGAHLLLPLSLFFIFSGLALLIQTLIDSNTIIEFLITGFWLAVSVITLTKIFVAGWKISELITTLKSEIE